MAKKLQLRRGTTSQHSSFTGAVGEVTVDTDKDVLVVHDGSTAGGFPSVRSGAIALADLGADCVDGTKIADDSLNSEHYIDGSIDLAHLSADCVDGTKIADDSLNSEHYVAGSIDLEHMSSESVDEDNLHISNAGSNGQFLSKQSGNTGGLTWASAGDASLDTAQTFTKGQRGEITALTDGSTITPDFADSNNFSVTLGGNRTLANPSNLTAGQSGSIFVTQDGTGSRTLAYGSYWDFAGGTAPTLTTTASAVDRIDYVVRTTGSIHAVATLALS